MATRVNVSGVPHAEITAGCVSAIATCGTTNACFTSRGVLVSEKCVDFVSKEIMSNRCLAQGFGLAEVKD